eukprot:TRINITY_DN22156_c0_g1_i4.p1 TRINITY_DN22156_c0_g1~~TRINITY_DN22156_c0_g1_i4.p1  ORF type:complete len:766 (+),score=164.12 TRINITY_DN22156_c0_g1_i4:152-2449(+)
MSFDAFDDWDATFLDQAAQLEEAAISARNATQSTSSFSIPLPSVANVSFSPPREFSQRFPDPSQSDPLPHKEVDRLKRELGRVSKQLTQLEHECVELRKDRDKKDEHLKDVVLQLEAKDAEIHHLKRINVEDEASVQVHPQMSLHARSNDIHHQVDTGHPISGTKCSSSTPWIREGMSKRLSRNKNNTLESGPSRKNVQMDGLSAVSELKRRVFIGNASTTSNGCSTEEDIFLEKTAQLKCSKSIGIQADLFEDASFFKNEVSFQNDLSNKLLTIWGSPNDKRSERSPFSKLLATCSSDLYVLFTCMNVSTNGENISDMTLHDRTHSVQSVEATKVSQLYESLTKVTTEMPQLDVLVEVLLDLCVLENVAVVHRSLRILRTVFQHICCFDLRCDTRDNIVVIHDQCSDILEEEKKEFTKNNEKVHNQVQFSVSWDERPSSNLSSSIIRSFDVESIWTKRHEKFGDMLASSANLISLFEMMHQIAMGNIEECIRVEAISIMNLILMKSNPYSERERFGPMPLFESVSQLLKKDAGVSVQQQALRLLFLLLNCPKLLVMFCDACNCDAESTGHVKDVAGSTDGQKGGPALQGRFGCILEGLAGCVGHRGNGMQECKLRRHAMIVLAFIASSGKSGFEILLNSTLSKGICFLELIVQVLALEADAEVAELAESRELCTERILLMREALILLNRLASNPMYSAAVLGVLMRSRATTSLIVDVAERISSKSRAYQSSDGMKRMHSKEAEIADLSRVFSARVFAFLENNLS